MSDRVPLAVPLTAIITGALLALIGLARPSFVWNLGKMRQGRDWMGETGMTVLFVVFGVAMIAVGLVAARKRSGT